MTIIHMFTEALFPNSTRCNDLCYYFIDRKFRFKRDCTVSTKKFSVPKLTDLRADTFLLYHDNIG